MGGQPPAIASDVRVWLGGYDISGAIEQVMLTAVREAIQNTQLADDVEGAYPGEMTVGADVKGFWSAVAGEPDTIVAPRMFGSAPDFSEWPLTFLPPVGSVAGADGACEYTLRAAHFGIVFGGAHGELIPFSLASRARAGSLDRGTVMLPKVSRTGSATGTAYQLGAVTTAAKVVCSLHVFGVTGGTVSVTVESGAVGMASPTTRATFDALTGIGRQTKEVTVVSADDYWRSVVTYTPGTSYVLAVVGARVAR